MRDIICQAIADALHVLGISYTNRIGVEIPPNKQHGDFSTNIAMTLARDLKKSPKIIAQEIISKLVFEKSVIERIDVAGNGFINFYISQWYLIAELKKILTQKETYGRVAPSGKKAIVEFVSANPTGPLTIGRGRGGVLGDVLANLIETQGYAVTREYYFNDAGRQMRVLADSVRLRYIALCGDITTFPDEYYQGEYIIEIAQKIADQFQFTKKNEPSLPFFKEFATNEMFVNIKHTLHRLGIHHTSFFNETTLYDKTDDHFSANEAVINRLHEKGFIKIEDGATWFLTTKLGDEKDKALIKSTGEPTYRLPDIAYHINKFNRGFDLMVNVFGADHIDEYPDVMRALRVLGYDDEKVKVAINQFVTMTVDGKNVKISTRKGNADLLDELIDEVGVDATRLFFVMRSKDSHLNFDLDLAKKQSNDNPIFYFQYAYARICSILSLVKEKNDINIENISMDVTDFSHPMETNLLKSLLHYPDILEYSVEVLEPQKLVTYLREVTENFHQFYEACRVIGEDERTMHRRIFLCKATQQLLKNGFSLLGISSPERM